MPNKFVLKKDVAFADSIILYNDANQYTRLLNAEFAGLDRNHMILGDLKIDSDSSTIETIQLSDNAKIQCDRLHKTIIDINSVIPTAAINSGLTGMLEDQGVGNIYYISKGRLENNTWYIVHFISQKNSDNVSIADSSMFCGIFCYSEDTQGCHPCLMIQNGYWDDPDSFMIWAYGMDENTVSQRGSLWGSDTIRYIGFHLTRSSAWRSPKATGAESGVANTCPVSYCHLTKLPIQWNVYNMGWSNMG